jgi:phage-related minor tail protein
MTKNQKKLNTIYQWAFKFLLIISFNNTYATGIETADSLFVTTSNTANAERKRAEALAVSSIELTKLSTALEGQANVTRARNEIESSLTSIQRESLQTQLDLGIITSENYRTQSIALEQADRLKQRDIKLDQLKNDLIITQIGLTKELNAATNADDIANIQAKMSNASRVYEVQADGVRKVFYEQERAKRLTEDLSDRQLAYGDVFKKSFEGMADAVIEFTKTGKLNFTSMIDSMIEGLIRYEMQQQALMMYAAFRPGLMSLVGSVFGPAAGSLDAGPGAYPAGRAKGGVYDAGVEMFAKGGMFTNSIVESPTLFKFAKGGSMSGNGTGLMGEAGPEAIMPLKRDSNGNLGVRSGGNQGNVDVVVNNYGTEKAETRETVDSRGNRKIEVIIGEMTAGEMTRSGSASQKALRGTFGLQPQLIRR